MRLVIPQRQQAIIQRESRPRRNGGPRLSNRQTPVLGRERPYPCIASCPFFLAGGCSADDISREFPNPTCRSGRIRATKSRRCGNEVFHVAIFRFANEHINDAVAAFRALATSSRRDPGNPRYDVYRSIADDQEFYVVEHWASPEALAAHGRTEAFIRYGQGVLVKYATLHDTVTAVAFSSSSPKFHTDN
jgi:quinol monooxygenase YgiN